MQRPFFKTVITLDELQRPTDFRTAMWWLYQTGVQPGHSTGWLSLDTHFTVRAREWTLITGIPGHGKTSLLDGLMVNLAKSQDWHWAVFSAENLPVERHASDLAAQYIGKPFGPGLRSRITEEEFNWATMFLDSHFTWLNPPEDDCTVDRILALAHILSTSGEGIQGLVIDPWNELDHSRPANMNETEYVSRALTKIRRFAREHEVHVFLVAHPVKLQRQKTADGSEAKTYPVPTPYDVSGSAHFRNKADNCLCVWRDVSNPGYGVDVHVQKIRFREVGKLGLVHMGYDAPTNQLFDSVGGRKTFQPPSKERLIEAFAGSREPGEEG